MAAFRRLAPGALLVATAFAIPAPIDARRDNARLYVSVVDGDGRPVTGLGPADIAVRENGVVREVVSFAPATDPLRLALLTDGLGIDPGFSAQDLRAALMAVVASVREAAPDSQIGLMRFDGAAVQQVKFTSGRAELDNAIRRLFTNKSTPVLLEAIDDSCKALLKLDGDRRVVLAIVGGYKDDQSSLASQRVADRLRLSHVALWALEGRSTLGENPRNVNRDAILRLGTQLSGGWHDTVSAGTALEGAARRMAALIVSQYALTYGPADGRDDGRLEFAVRPGLHVLAPSWTAQ